MHIYTRPESEVEGNVAGLDEAVWVYKGDLCHPGLDPATRDVVEAHHAVGWAQQAAPLGHIEGCHTGAVG